MMQLTVICGAFSRLIVNFGQYLVKLLQIDLTPSFIQPTVQNPKTSSCPVREREAEDPHTEQEEPDRDCFHLID